MGPLRTILIHYYSTVGINDVMSYLNKGSRRLTVVQQRVPHCSYTVYTGFNYNEVLIRTRLSLYCDHSTNFGLALEEHTVKDLIYFL